MQATLPHSDCNYALQRGHGRKRPQGELYWDARHLLWDIRLFGPQSEYQEAGVGYG